MKPELLDERRMMAGPFEKSGQPDLRFFRPGIYLHYKGKLYEATHLVHDANDDARLAIHYVGLQLDAAQEGPRHAVRSWADWYAYVHRDGSLCVNATTVRCPDDGSHIIPRFRYIGPAFEGWMLECDPWRQ